MGEIVAAAVVSHQPGIMAPEPMRKAVGRGSDTTLVPGFATMRQALDDARVDTLVIFDTHWFTTVEHVIAGAAHFKGIYTSEELPTLIQDYAYDYPGAPSLAAGIAEVARERKLRVLNATNPHITQHYPTLNLIHYLRGQRQVLSIGTCQTAMRHNFLDFGAAIAEAVRRGDGRVALLAAGGMSHRFWPMDEVMNHFTYSPDDVVSKEARAIDERILDLWAHGDHTAVLELYPEYRANFSPEGFFGHYLMTVGALGGAKCKARGRLMSKYENAIGTGQVHVWFDLN
jgi:3,4-dihydroxyphenylacetate 2,3-dioxygenase